METASELPKFVEALMSVGFLYLIYRWWKSPARRLKKEQKKAAKILAAQNRQWAQENNLREVKGNLKVVLESIGIARTSKNLDTVVSRYNVAIERLYGLLQRFPYRTDWQRLCAELVVEKSKAIHKQLMEKIDKMIEKANSATKSSTKISTLDKAVHALNEAVSSSEYNSALLKNKTLEIQRMIHLVEFTDLREIAERHEFKENWQKALDAYQNALFYAKSKGIDGTMRDIINKIEHKLTALKDKV